MKTKIFVSYSHSDAKYVSESHRHSILKFIRGLQDELDVEIWFDEKISTGQIWNDEIKKNINESHIAICLVSQSFLDSPYIKHKEIPKFLKKRREFGMVIYSIILSDCDWQEHDWLAETQFIPSGQRNVEEHFNANKRMGIYTTIRKELKALIIASKPIKSLSKSDQSTRQIIINSDEELTLEAADAYMDTGDYVSAKNLFLGGMNFNDIPFQKQLNILIIEQKYGMLREAQIHLDFLQTSNLLNISKTQKALLHVVNLKVQSQTHNFNEVISQFADVLQLLGETKQEVRACSVFNRAGIAYAALGLHNESHDCLEKGLEIATKYNEHHLKITSKMYQSIAQFFSGVYCQIEDPLVQIQNCQLSYFNHPINTSNLILWQTYNFKSIVQCLFAEAAIYLGKGKAEKGYTRLTAANLLSQVAKSNPKAEGYAELLSVINQSGIRKKIEIAMYPDELHKDKYQKKITSISYYLTQLQKVIPQLYHNPNIDKWMNFRDFLNEFDKLHS